MITANIKNLAIALEALSRIPGVLEISEDVRQLLKQEVRDAQRKDATTVNKPQYTESSYEDRIPF